MNVFPLLVLLLEWIMHLMILFYSTFNDSSLIIGNWKICWVILMTLNGDFKNTLPSKHYKGLKKLAGFENNFFCDVYVVVLGSYTRLQAVRTCMWKLVFQFNPFCSCCKGTKFWHGNIYEKVLFMVSLQSSKLILLLLANLNYVMG